MNSREGVINIFKITQIFFNTCGLYFNLDRSDNANEMQVVSTSKETLMYSFTIVNLFYVRTSYYFPDYYPLHAECSKKAEF